MSDKKQPFCWKCVSRITEQQDNISSTLIGCKEEKNIHNYSDAKKMCPLLFLKDKVLIIINKGMAQMEYKPDNIEIEIRDYDIDGADEFPENRPDCKKDEDGDWYQEMIFPAEDDGSEIVTLPPMTLDVEIKYRNFYEHCGEKWEDCWDSMCNDKCPVCDKEIEPYKSEEIKESIGWQPAPDDFPVAGLQTFEVYEDLEMGKGCHPEVKNWIEIFEGMIEKSIIIPSDKDYVAKYSRRSDF